MKTLFSIAILFVLIRQPIMADVQDPETRCGWFFNINSERSILHDRDGEWLIADIGKYEAKGNWTPELNRDDDAAFVRTKGIYGYGCVCMRVQADLNQKKILSVSKVNPKKLADCVADKHLRQSELTITAMTQIEKAKKIQVEKKISDLDRANLSKETQKKIFIRASKVFAKIYKKKFTDYGSLEIDDFTCKKNGVGFSCEKYWPPMECPEGPSKGGRYSPKNSFYFEIKSDGEIFIDSTQWETYEDSCS